MAPECLHQKEKGGKMSSVLQKLQEEIQDIRVSIGIEEKHIKDQTRKLIEYNIKNIEDAKKLLKKLDTELKKLEDEVEDLAKKAKDFLSQINLEDE
mgnify:CR=1 FL=1